MTQTLRRLGGRQPLCGIGVTSLMPTTSMPVFWIVRIAVSRPEPGPFTTTSTLRTPCSIARRAAVSAASCAANGVLLREPLKPTLPADAQAMRVALLVGDRDDRVVERRLDVRDAVGDVLALAPLGTSTAGCRLCHASRSLLLRRLRYLRAFLRPATVFFGPLRVRALVRVR